MDDQNKNLILATVLSFVVIMVWFVVFPPELADEATTPTSQTAATEDTAPGGALIPNTAPTTGQAQAPAPEAATTDETPEAARIPLDTPRMIGSVSLLGGRIDEVALKDYRTELGPDAPNVALLNPVDSGEPFYALYGWAPSAGVELADLPGPTTIWSVESGETLTPQSPLTLRWDSPAGLIFRRTISVDDEYMFGIEQSVENTTDTPVRAGPYATVVQHGTPSRLENFFIAHEGAIGQLTDELLIEKYSNLEDMDQNADLRAQGQVFSEVQNGWIGLTDKYFMTTLVPPAGQTFDIDLVYVAASEIFQVRTRYPSLEVAPGATVSQASQLFVGAKEWEVIRTYQNEGGITNFLDSIDWGWFYFLTKPIFALLHWLNAQIGNMGWAIIGLTLIIKAALFPLAYKSYVSMAKMKELQPEMEKIKEKAGDDKQKLQTEMMALYKKNKVNPAAGCLPILLQVPIFFSLYKVIFVTIELRHAAWFGVFQDLSGPDPTSIMNLFGLLPFAGPEPGSLMATAFLGILPLLLGISMWLQQKLNPAPPDPTQAMIFAWMPWVFMFMLGSFASGLVVYWIANNVITFTQQYLIMRSQGYSPDIIGNIKSSFKKKAPAEDKK